MKPIGICAILLLHLLEKFMIQIRNIFCNILVKRLMFYFLFRIRENNDDGMRRMSIYQWRDLTSIVWLICKLVVLEGFIWYFSSNFRFKVMLNIGNISLPFLMLSCWIHNVMSYEFQMIDVLNLSFLTIKMWSIVNSSKCFSFSFVNLVLYIIFQNYCVFHGHIITKT